MLEIVVSEAWTRAHPGAAVGILAIEGVANPQRHPGLDRRKRELEEQLRSRYAAVDRAALKAMPVLQAYAAYYRRFKKTYHVQLQLESVVRNAKSIPQVAALVEAMFMAELKNQLLTAGHDLDVVDPPVRIDVAAGAERYARMNGQEQQLKQGDMYIADAAGILSSIIYGPDRRTQITAQTTRALFTVYAPPGISRPNIVAHLRDIVDYARLVTPEASVEALAVHEARDPAT